ncbi:MAG: hypothetical protein N2044_08800 [Cyclobacteriaceae bacterium]|nr:hypothetical protein [Cyclobacteriaceae bacterium]MCX7637928.1 hypothetical protein [Cyclobacteriaceae bacterium]
MKTCLLAGLIAIAGYEAIGQAKTDTVVVELTRSSRVVFTLSDRNDLPLLRQYDFQALFNHILNKVEGVPAEAISDTLADKQQEYEEVIWEDDEEGDRNWREVRIKRVYRKPRSSFNLDLGMNNYLTDGNFPNGELYEVRPWGSWYVAMNSVQRMRIGGKFYTEWALGLSWYTFKFENDNLVISKDENGVIFAEDLTPGRNFRKSKISASYLQASFIPVLDFGGSGRKARIWDAEGSRFRIGFGPYAAYRIGSHSKLVYSEGSGKEKDKDRDSFYLENFRYGLRLQLGIRSTDLFVNYDLNNLFSDKPNNPRLNAISFGIIF